MPHLFITSVIGRRGGPGGRFMRTGRIEANLPILNAEYRLPFVPDLIQRKVSPCSGSPS